MPSEVPYKDCLSCMATKWCKVYQGEISKGDKNWCVAKYRLESALKLSNLPKIYLNANLAGMDREGVDDKLLNIVDRYANDILNTVKGGVNFFFYSHLTGVGKTYAAMVLLNQFIYKACLTNEWFDFENPLALFIVHADLMDDLRYRRDENNVQDTLKRIAKVPLLVLDDLGSGTSSAFVKDQTYQIVNGRLNQGLSTIYTTNLSLAGLKSEDVLGPRTVSRITGNCVGTKVEGTDRRIKTSRGD